MPTLQTLAASIAAHITIKANHFDAYGPEREQQTDEQGRLWFRAASPLDSDAVEIAPPGQGFAFDMWRPEEEDESQAESDAADIAHSIAFGILAARRIEARRVARLNLLRARIMRRALERNRLTARAKPGGQCRARRAHAAMMRIERVLLAEYIAANKAERAPII